MIYDIDTVEPLADFVLLKRCPAAQMTSGDKGSPVYMATSEENNLCIVVGVGPGRDGIKGTEPTLKPDDLVLCDKFVGVKVELDGVQHFLVKHYDCHAKVSLTDKGMIDLRHAIQNPRLLKETPTL